MIACGENLKILFPKLTEFVINTVNGKNQNRTIGTLFQINR